MPATLYIALTVYTDNRPGGSKFEVVRQRPGLYIDLFSAQWGNNELGYGMRKHAQARWVWGHAPPGKF